jgi:hypothetical protein
MSDLKKTITEVFKENLYECEVVLRSDRDKNLTIVTDNLRGVCGITVVSVLEPAAPVSSAVERTLLRVKFFLLEPTIRQHVKRMAIEARKIGGIYSFVPRKVKKVISRIYK